MDLLLEIFFYSQKIYNSNLAGLVIKKTTTRITKGCTKFFLDKLWKIRLQKCLLHTSTGSGWQ